MTLKRTVRGFSSIALLRFSLGLFLAVLGITSISPDTGEGLFGLSRGHTSLEISFGIVELLCGVFLLADTFLRLPKRISALVILIILGLWLFRVGYVGFYQGLSFRRNGILFRPDFWSWLLALATDLVIASGLYGLLRTERT